MITQIVTLSNAQEGKYKKWNKILILGLIMLIRLSGTRTQRVMKNSSNKFHQKALNGKRNRQIEIAMCFKEGAGL